MTDKDGNEKERQAFDPWGNRREPDDWTSLITTPVSHITGRGYTMHEHLDGFALINMNGRVYDPQIARFLSPDPILQEPGYWLNYNRYGYCLNNPLIYTDPSGYTWKIFEPFVNAWNWAWDTANQSARFLQKKGISVNIQGGVNSTNGFYTESGGHRQYTNQIGVDPAQQVNNRINDARGSKTYVSGNSSLADVAAIGGGETWYYGVQGTSDVSSHAFVYNPNAGMIYEINHVSADPNVELGFVDKMSGLTGIQSGSVISIGRKYNMNDAEGRLSFMNFRDDRPNIRLIPVNVLNPHRSSMFFESFVGRSWHYSLLNINCKYYAITGLRLGGVNNILIQSPLPTVFNGINIRNIETVQPNW